MRRGSLVCCLIFATLLGNGCGGDRALEVSGHVTLDGAPLEQGVITFRPAAGDGPTAEALITAGQYTARLAPGPKQVEIQGFRQIGEQPAFPGDPSSPMIPQLEPIVSPQYNRDSTLTLDVDSATSDADFALQITP